MRARSGAIPSEGAPRPITRSRQGRRERNSKKLCCSALVGPHGFSAWHLSRLATKTCFDLYRHTRYFLTLCPLATKALGDLAWAFNAQVTLLVRSTALPPSLGVPPPHRHQCLPARHGFPPPPFHCHGRCSVIWRLPPRRRGLSTPAGPHQRRPHGPRRGRRRRRRRGWRRPPPGACA